MDLTGDPAPTLGPVGVAYARALEARRRVPPVAGGPTPAIPRLDGKPLAPGHTMSDNARLEREMEATRAAEAAAAPAGSILQRGVPPRAPAGPPAGTAAAILSRLRPDDTLPPGAAEDPAYIHAMGSGIAVNQPGLAARYGVIRGGRHVPPEELAGEPPPRPGALREKTIEGLKAIAAANTPEARAQSAPTGEGGAAPAPRGSNDLPAAPEVPAVKSTAFADPFDVDVFQQLLQHDVLNNPEQRKLIESRLQPLDLGELFVNGVVCQRVPVHPGKFELEFQSTTGDDMLNIKRRLFELAMLPTRPPDDYLYDLSTIWQTAILLKAVYVDGRATPFPSHRDAQGRWDDALFDSKVAKVRGLNDAFIASIGLNGVWFLLRVRRLFTAEATKNG